MASCPRKVTYDFMERQFVVNPDGRVAAGNQCLKDCPRMCVCVCVCVYYCVHVCAVKCWHRHFSGPWPAVVWLWCRPCQQVIYSRPLPPEPSVHSSIVCLYQCLHVPLLATLLCASCPPQKGCLTWTGAALSVVLRTTWWTTTCV